MHRKNKDLGIKMLLLLEIRIIRREYMQVLRDMTELTELYLIIQYTRQFFNSHITFYVGPFHLCLVIAFYSSFASFPLFL